MSSRISVFEDYDAGSQCLYQASYYQKPSKNCFSSTADLDERNCCGITIHLILINGVSELPSIVRRNHKNNANDNIYEDASFRLFSKRQAGHQYETRHREDLLVDDGMNGQKLGLHLKNNKRNVL